MYWQPGQELKTRPYKIEGTIGQGGFGVTYKAQHLGLKHQVVLKTPNSTLRNDPAYPRFEQRFIEEGQMLAQLAQKGHASIVRVSDLFTEDNIPCLVMNFVPGDSLFNLVQKQGAIPETEAVGYIRQIAEVLIVSHEMEIVHRDAHALNIMVANQTRAVLIDFGIAGDITPMVSKTRNAFNPAFAPYEQILDGRGLPTVDVYSLGASLYYAVTGELPTPAAKRKLDNLALVPPKQHNPQISDKLQTAIIQAMALEAADRPQTMRDFLALLQPNQQPVSPPPTSTASAPKPVPAQTQKTIPATRKAMPASIPEWQPTGKATSARALPKQRPPAAVRTSADLRGYFVLPELKPQGMVRRLGRGSIREVIPLNPQLTIVIAHGGATLFNLRTGEALWEIDCPANGGALSADGRLLALGGSKDIYLWHLSTGQFLRKLTGHTNWVNSVAISPNGQTLASGSSDKTVRLWDVATGRQLKQLTGHTRDLTSVAISPNGQILASGSYDKTLRLWDVAAGRELKQLTGHKYSVNSVVISPNGQILASGSGDETVRLWDVATGRQLKQLTGHKYSVNSVAISPNGQILASGSDDNTVRLWDLSVSGIGFWKKPSGKQLQQLTGHTSTVNGVTISPNGQILASGSWDQTVRLWDVATGRQLQQLTGHTGIVNGVSISPNGQILASGSWDKTVRLWDVATGRQLKQLRGYGYSVAISPNGQILASESLDKTVRLWDVATGRELQQLTGHTGIVNGVSISPNGQILASGSDDKTVRLWDVATGRELQQLTGHTGIVNSVAISPNGQILASGSDDKTVRLWDMATGRELQLLTGHTGIVNSVAFSPNGQILASGSWDKTVRLWDVSTAQELKQFTGHTRWVNAVTISPNGQILASGGQDGVVRLWRL